MHTIWRGLILVSMGILLTLFGLGAGCGGSSAAAPKPSAAPRTFDGARAWADLLTQVAMGPRVPGTAAHLQTRDWLNATLTQLGAEVQLQPFSAELGGRTVAMWNVLATVPGTGPAPRELVLLCAHWDSRPTAEHDPDPAKRTQPVLGANDGASGVAVLLELARQLAARPVARDVLFVFFDGEDYGPNLDKMLLGSKYFAAHLPARKPAWGILLDMVGDADLAIYREPNSEARARAVNDRVFSAARALGYLRVGTLSGFVDAPFAYPITDDHIPLNDAGIPTADLIDFTYPPWHTTGDTADKCNADSLRIVGRTVLEAISQP
jgi:glutaminyl-peptide cyclotransferase